MLNSDSSKIAVVIPVYNGIGVVDRCISALEAQTIQPDEIICVDDASPDGSREYIRAKYPQVTVLHNRVNIGASGSYGRGIRYAYRKNYDWIWLLDQDDVPRSNSLEELLKFSRRYKGRKVVFCSTLVYPNLMYVYTMVHRSNVVLPLSNMNYNFPYEALLPSFAGMLLPRELIREVGLPLVELTMDCADWEYSLRMGARGWRIVVVPTSIIYHRGGNPVITPAVYRRSFIRLERGGFRRVRWKMRLTSIYPPHRYFTRGRNTLLVATLPYTPPYVKPFLLRWLLGTFVKLLTVERQKIAKIRAYLLGIAYGILDSFPRWRKII